MADTASGIAATTRRPEHLQRLYWQARDEAERTRGGILYTPDDDALVSTIYLSLRMRAYQREAEPFMKQKAQIHMIFGGSQLFGTKDGGIVARQRPLPPDAAAANASLDEVLACLMAKYELVPPNEASCPPAR